MLILLQAVLGFDNLLYISLEPKRAPLERQRQVRNMGIGLAVLLRIVLLFALTQLIELFQDPVFRINPFDVIHGTFNIHSIIVVLVIVDIVEGRYQKKLMAKKIANPGKQ